MADGQGETPDLQAQLREVNEVQQALLHHPRSFDLVLAAIARAGGGKVRVEIPELAQVLRDFASPGVILTVALRWEPGSKPFVELVAHDPRTCPQARAVMDGHMARQEAHIRNLVESWRARQDRQTDLN